MQENGFLDWERVFVATDGSMMDNGVRVFYLTADGTVKGTECFPALGLYNSLTWKEKGRISSDLGVTKPSLKKVAHHGAYGFWSVE